MQAGSGRPGRWPNMLNRRRVRPGRPTTNASGARCSHTEQHALAKWSENLARSPIVIPKADLVDFSAAVDIRNLMDLNGHTKKPPKGRHCEKENAEENPRPRPAFVKSQETAETTNHQQSRPKPTLLLQTAPRSLKTSGPKPAKPYRPESPSLEYPKSSVTRNPKAHVLKPKKIYIEILRPIES